MQETTKYLKLPFFFDEERLIADLSAVTEGRWIPHFNTRDYEGDWKVIPLYAKDGNDKDIFAHSPSDSNISETKTLKQSPYFEEVIKTFKCPILTARILRLGAGAEIKAHRDYNLGYEDGCFRLHIPIVTNSDVHFVLGGDELTMLPGECWYTNVNFVHSVRNEGDEDRVHLIIDGQRNAWSDKLFFSLAPEESFRPMAREPDSPETIRRTIEELERQNKDEYKPLIEELKLILNS